MVRSGPSRATSIGKRETDQRFFAKTKATKGIVIAFGRSDKGIDFDAMDHKAVNLFFLIAAPEDAIGAHLNVMARLSYIMKSEENRQKMMTVTSPGELLQMIDTVE